MSFRSREQYRNERPSRREERAPSGRARHEDDHLTRKNSPAGDRRRDYRRNDERSGGGSQWHERRDREYGGYDRSDARRGMDPRRDREREYAGGRRGEHRQRDRIPGWQDCSEYDRYDDTYNGGGRQGEGSRGRRDNRDEHRKRYQDELMGGLERDSDYSYEKSTRERERERSPSPQRVLLVKNLPEEADVEELKNLFISVPGVMGIYMDDKFLGEGRSILVMTDVEAAIALMNSAWRDQAYCRDKRMKLSYAAEWISNKMVSEFLHDWVCAQCHKNNFATRGKCFSCHAPRTLACMTANQEEPTNCLKIENVATTVDEHGLKAFLKSMAPLRGLRFLRRKISGDFTGIAYASFASVDVATLVMTKIKAGALFEGDNSSSWKVKYAFDDLTGGAGQAPEPEKIDTGPDDLEKLDWEPAAFDAKQIEIRDNEAAASTQGDFNAEMIGFVYDPESGYMKEIVSGLFYDKNTGFYFNPAIQMWGTKDPITNAFTPYQEPQSTHGEELMVSTAKDVSSHPHTQDTEKATGSVEPKAVIGAAPQINKDLLKNKQSKTKEEGKVVQQSDSEASKEGVQPKKAVAGIIHKGKWARKSSG